MDTNDCLRCGCPIQDHCVPFRYAFKCWIRHGFLTRRERMVCGLERWLLATRWF